MFDAIALEGLDFFARSAFAVRRDAGADGFLLAPSSKTPRVQLVFLGNFYAEAFRFMTASQASRGRFP
jgi:hypothetical protein